MFSNYLITIYDESSLYEDARNQTVLILEMKIYCQAICLQQIAKLLKQQFCTSIKINVYEISSVSKEITLCLD